MKIEQRFTRNKWDGSKLQGVSETAVGIFSNGVVIARC